MDIKVAKNAGFCFGVKRATDSLEGNHCRLMPCSIRGFVCVGVFHSFNNDGNLQAMYSGIDSMPPLFPLFFSENLIAIAGFLFLM